MLYWPCLKYLYTFLYHSFPSGVSPFLIPLDIFLEGQHNISNRLDAWLTVIASSDPERILDVVRAYPEFGELYCQVFRFRDDIKELMNMFSEALKILDTNTTKYMIEEQKEKLRKQEEEIRKQRDTRLEKTSPSTLHVSHVSAQNTGTKCS